jgi:hypothetical protein
MLLELFRDYNILYTPYKNNVPNTCARVYDD